MLNIIYLKKTTGLPTDAVDTVNQSVFKNIDSSRVNFVEEKNSLARLFSIWRLKPDYIFGIGNVSEVFYVLLKPKSTKYIIGWHTRLRITKTWPIRSFLFRQADLVIGVSECVVRTVTDHFPQKKAVAILNGVDTTFFNPEKTDEEYLNQKFNISFDRPIILFVGALFERKRPDIFIEVAKRYSKANFILVGRKGKKDFITSTQDLTNFQWIPSMDRKDISIMMASADVFLFPSIDEPCAAVIPEALSSGLPALLSKSCGNKELIEHGISGFLVNQSEKEVSELIDYLDQLLTDKILLEKMGKAARERCVGELNWEKVARKYQEVLLSQK